jgi:hypothetical protein
LSVDPTTRTRRRNPRVARLARAAALANPLSSLFALAFCVSHTNVAAKAHGVAEAERLQEREQLLIAKAAVGQDGHMAIR